MDNDKSLNQAIYNPRIFEVKNVDEAKGIILTPEKGINTEERWEKETPFTIKQIRELLQPDSNSLLLDYGCGIGRIAKGLIQKLSCRVLGVDISLTMRQLAPGYVNSPLFSVCSTEIFDAMLDKGLVFDSAYSIWVIQHCLDPAQDLDRIKKALKPSGRLYILNNLFRAVPTNKGWVNDNIDMEDLFSQHFKEVWSSPIPDWLIFPEATKLTLQKVYQHKQQRNI
jgi:SAM-dependent methyltransferase